MLTVTSTNTIPIATPRFQYDCAHCKYNWCCGYTCGCLYDGKGARDVLPDPPIAVRTAVNFARHGKGMMPKYIDQEALKHLPPEASAKLMQQQLEKNNGR